jgi:hypothetical protein
MEGPLCWLRFDCGRAAPRSCMDGLLDPARLERMEGLAWP